MYDNMIYERCCVSIGKDMFADIAIIWLRQGTRTTLYNNTL